MCGIAGIINFTDKPVLESELRAMTNTIAHRGPDGEGFFIDGCVGLGHRRLAILDLNDTGKQPMSYANGRYWITFNGEIYNFLEIRHELEQKGYEFYTQSDTEVVLAAYDCWGDECLLCFNGMWAFALWDRQEKELFLARDRFGVKPLFFYSTPHHFAFASEIKALLQTEGIDPQPHPAIVRDYLGFSTPLTHRQTIYDGVFRMDAGGWMKISPDGIKKQTIWWNTWDHRPQIPVSAVAQVEQFLDLLQDAIRIRLRSDVPVGTLLSGGMDSSAIVGIIARFRSGPDWMKTGQRLAPDWQRTFTAEYPGFSVDESEYARAVLDSAKINGTWIHPTVDDMPAFVEHMIAQQDAPITQSLYAAHTVYRAVSQAGVKVTLDGQGADELLSGYGTLSAAKYYFWNFQFRQMHQALESNLLMSQSLRSLDDYQKQFIFSELGERYHIRSRMRGFFGFHSAKIIASEPEYGAPSAGLLRLDELDDEYKAPEDANQLDTDLYRQVHYSYLPGILHRFDHAAMSYSVESRMPFLDWRLVTYCFALPSQQKVNRGITKWILRRAMQGILPDKVLQRRSKLGFPIPAEWLVDQSVQAWVRQIIYDSRFQKIEYWNGAKFQRWFEQKSKTGWQSYDHVTVFNVVSTYLWYLRLLDCTKRCDGNT